MSFFIVDPLLGGEDGPLTQSQLIQLIRKKKLKKKHMLRITGREGLFKAGDVLAKAFIKIETEWESEAAAERERKNAAKEDARQEKLSKKAKQKTQAAIQRQSAKRAADSEVGPYHGFDFAKTIFNVLSILSVIAGIISLAVTTLFLVVAFNKGDAFWPALFVAGAQCLATVVSTLLVVGSMMFLRNFIDWMLNVEGLLIKNR